MYSTSYVDIKYKIINQSTRYDVVKYVGLDDTIDDNERDDNDEISEDIEDFNEMRDEDKTDDKIFKHITIA